MKTQQLLIRILILFALILSIDIQESNATAPSTISIQGTLTNASDIPITGTRNVTLKIYSDEDVMLCESTQSVSVNNGLFTTKIETCTTTDIDGKDLYLGIQVEGDAEMTPRQQITPAPYAMSLIPGAKIIGDVAPPILTVKNLSGDGIRVDADDYGLYVGSAGRDGVWVDQAVDDGFYVSNAGGDGLYVGNAVNYGVYVLSAGVDGVYARSDSTTGRGVYGWANTESGINYGVYGRSDSPDGYGVYGYNNDTGGIAIMAGGTGIIKSVADTDITVSIYKVVFNSDDSPTPDILPIPYGYVWMRPTGTGSKHAIVPVDSFSKLFGTQQKLKSIRACYELDNTTS